MRRRLFASIIILLFHAGANAQNSNTVKIAGHAILFNNTPAKNATATLLRSKDSATIKLTITDENGAFEFDNIAAGNYLVSISHTGYKKYISGVLVADNKNAAMDLGRITLQQHDNRLAEVTVEAKKPFIERKADRMIVNVENSITSTGSTALEVLEKAPGVLVNQESGLNLKGKSGVLVMIDGKPSPLSGADLITYLKGIPAANIERIEIITNPSAKYDAADNAGIIDIRFKKDKREGYNGSAGASLGQGIYSKPSANASINYRQKKWNVFGNYAFTAPKSFTDFYINRKFFTPGTGKVESVFDQSTFTRQPQNSNNLKLGADFYASKKTVVGFMFNGSAYNGTRDGLSTALITNADNALLYTNKTANVLKDKRQSGFGNLNFKHSFDSTGTELNADFDYGKFNARPYQDIFSTSVDPNNALLSSGTQKSDQQSTITVTSFKSDFVYPLKNKAKFEAGIKTSFVTTNNDVRFYNVVNAINIPDTTRSNHFIYTENVNAAYVNYNKEFKTTGIQAGLRMEHTHTKGTQVAGNQNTSRNYVQLFPSFAVTQKIDATNELSFSYSRRIDRPTYRQLNPFKILVDSYTYVLGDPMLNPSLSDSYQFGYTFKSLYSATLSYIKSKDVITDVFVQNDATKISSQVPANLQTFSQYDLSVNIPVNIKKWMSTNISASADYNDYKSPLQGGNLINSSFCWAVNLSSSFVMGKKGWSAELNGFYQSRTPWGQFIIRDLAQVSTGIQKISKNKKSVYKIAMADIFSTNHIAVIVQYQNQDWHTDRTWDSRFVTFSYTYRFGKNTVARARQRTSGAEDEKRRAN